MLLHPPCIRTHARHLASVDTSRAAAEPRAVVDTLPRGVTKEVLKEGTGAAVQHGQNVTVHCIGFGKNGDLSLPFWSTRDPGQRAFTFRVGEGRGDTSVGCGGLDNEGRRAGGHRLGRRERLWLRRVSELGDSARQHAEVRD